MTTLPQSRSRRRGLAAAAAWAVTPMAAMPAAGADQPRPLEVGQPAPGFELAGVDGKTVSLAHTVRSNRATVINFWATWCGPCMAELPEFDEVHRQLAPHGLAILAINAGEKVDKVRAWAARAKMSFPLLLDPDGDAREAYFVFAGLPVTWVIDRKGILRHRFATATTGAALRAVVQALLKEGG